MAFPVAIESSGAAASPFPGLVPMASTQAQFKVRRMTSRDIGQVDPCPGCAEGPGLGQAALAVRLYLPRQASSRAIRTLVGAGSMREVHAPSACTYFVADQATCWVRATDFRSVVMKPVVVAAPMSLRLRRFRTTNPRTESESTALVARRRPRRLMPRRGTLFLLMSFVLLGPALITSPTATACSGSFGGSYQIDPVFAQYRQWHWDSNWCASWPGDWVPLSCEVVPVIEIGDPIVNGYREGTYLYACDLALGSHTDNRVSVSDPGGGAPVCQTVPDVFILGQHVPGTGQTYCTPNGGTSVPVPLDTPDAVPSRGYFQVYPYGYNYFDVAQAIGRCTQPGWESGVHGYLSLGPAGSVWYVNCRA